MISETKLTVRYAETDQMGVTHHAVYPVWYEAARADYMKQLGYSYSKLEQDGIMAPVIDLSCHYAGATRYEDELTVRTWISRITPARVEFTYEVYKAGESSPCNFGKTVHAWVDKETFRPLSLKKQVPVLYEKAVQSLL